MPLNVHAQKKSVERSCGKEIRSTSQWQYVVAYIYAKSKGRVNIPRNAIDDDVVDIVTLYPPWSLDTNDRCDITQIANDQSVKEIQDEFYKDTPVKTEINKPYIDNIDAYNRDRALITKSLSDRLDLGQNSLLGAQQVRVAVKHTDQLREFPEHLR